MYYNKAITFWLLLVSSASNVDHSNAFTTNKVWSAFKGISKIQNVRTIQYFPALNMMEVGDQMPSENGFVAAYDKWRRMYKRGTFDNYSFQNFKTNWRRLVEINAEAVEDALENELPRPVLLTIGEYGDCDPQDFEKAMNSSGFVQRPQKGGFNPNDQSWFPSADRVSSIYGNNVPNKPAESRIVDPAEAAYSDWCKEYGKRPDPDRFQAFCINYRKIEEHRRRTGEKIALSEHADLSPREYSNLQRSMGRDPNGGDTPGGSASWGSGGFSQTRSRGIPTPPDQGYPSGATNNRSARVQSGQYGNPSSSTRKSDPIEQAYIDWCRKFSKQPEQRRFEIFARRYKQIDDHYEQTGEQIQLTESADRTQEEIFQSKQSGARASPTATSQAVSAEAERAWAGYNNTQEFNGGYGYSDGSNRNNNTMYGGGYPANVGGGGGGQQFPTVSAEEVADAYQAWCEEFNRQPDQLGFQSFSVNFRQLENHFRLTGETLPLTEFADCPPQEFQNSLPQGISMQSQPRSTMNDPAQQYGRSWGPAADEPRQTARTRRLSEPMDIKDYGGSQNRNYGGPYSQSSNQPPQQPIAPPEEVEAVYMQWCEHYNKQPDQKRFEIFSTKYRQAEKIYRETGEQIELNEFADRTANEVLGNTPPGQGGYGGGASNNYGPNSSQQDVDANGFGQAASAAYPPPPSSGGFPDMTRNEGGFNGANGNTQGFKRYGSDPIYDAYLAWCDEYRKEPDPIRFQAFSINYENVSKTQKGVGKKIHLNQYADRPPEEFDNFERSPQGQASGPPGSSYWGGTGDGNQAGYQQTQYEPSRQQAPRQVNDPVADAYREWCAEHKKQPDQIRFQSFSENYEQVLKHYRETGERIPLNEYADRSPQEFGRSWGTTSPRANPSSRDNVWNNRNGTSPAGGYSEGPSNNAMSSKGPVADAYRQWCLEQKKQPDQGRFQMFAENYRQVEKHYRETGEMYELNEFADRPPQDYKRSNPRKIRQQGEQPSGVQSRGTQGSSSAFDVDRPQEVTKTNAQGIADAYRNWCAEFKKQPDQIRFQSFSENYQQVLRHYRETGERIPLNEYADRSPREFGQSWGTASPRTNPGSGDRVWNSRNDTYLGGYEQAKTGYGFPPNINDNYQSDNVNGNSRSGSPPNVNADRSSVGNQYGKDVEAIRAEFREWCAKLRREPNEDRFQAFAENYRRAEQHFRETREKLSMNEFADRPFEQFLRSHQRPSGSPTTQSQPNGVNGRNNTMPAGATKNVSGNQSRQNPGQGAYGGGGGQSSGQGAYAGGRQSSGQGVFGSQISGEEGFGSTMNGNSGFRPNGAPGYQTPYTAFQTASGFQENDPNAFPTNGASGYPTNGASGYPTNGASGYPTNGNMSPPPPTNGAGGNQAGMNIGFQSVGNIAFQSNDGPEQGDTGNKEGEYVGFIDESGCQPLDGEGQEYFDPIETAYLRWCGQYKKEPDADRFNIYAMNYRFVQQHEKETGEKLPLNEYADCTEEEYAEIQKNNKKKRRFGRGSSDNKWETLGPESTKGGSMRGGGPAPNTFATQPRVNTGGGTPSASSTSRRDKPAPNVGGTVNGSAQSPNKSPTEKDPIQAAYNDWCKQFRKRPDADRFQAFSQNYKRVEEYFRKTGERISLNENADFFGGVRIPTTGGSSSGAVNGRTSQQKNTGKTETVQFAYTEWCNEYNKQPDQQRFKAFAENFKRAQEHYKKTGEKIPLNVNADTPGGFKVPIANQSVVNGSTPSSQKFVSMDPAEVAYVDWCKQHNKQPDPQRFEAFAASFREAEKHYKETGNRIQLNEYADRTKDEVARILQKQNSPTPQAQGTPTPQKSIDPDAKAKERQAELQRRRDRRLQQQQERQKQRKEKLKSYDTPGLLDEDDFLLEAFYYWKTMCRSGGFDVVDFEDFKSGWKPLGEVYEEAARNAWLEGKDPIDLLESDEYEAYSATGYLQILRDSIIEQADKTLSLEVESVKATLVKDDEKPKKKRKPAIPQPKTAKMDGKDFLDAKILSDSDPDEKSDSESTTSKESIDVVSSSIPSSPSTPTIEVKSESKTDLDKDKKLQEKDDTAKPIIPDMKSTTDTTKDKDSTPPVKSDSKPSFTDPNQNPFATAVPKPDPNQNPFATAAAVPKPDPNQNPFASFTPPPKPAATTTTKPDTSMAKSVSDTSKTPADESSSSSSNANPMPVDEKSAAGPSSDTKPFPDPQKFPFAKAAGGEASSNDKFKVPEMKPKSSDTTTADKSTDKFAVPKVKSFNPPPSKNFSGPKGTPAVPAAKGIVPKTAPGANKFTVPSGNKFSVPGGGKFSVPKVSKAPFAKPGGGKSPEAKDDKDEDLQDKPINGDSGSQ